MSLKDKKVKIADKGGTNDHDDQMNVSDQVDSDQESDEDYAYINDSYVACENEQDFQVILLLLLLILLNLLTLLLLLMLLKLFVLLLLLILLTLLSLL